MRTPSIHRLARTGSPTARLLAGTIAALLTVQLAHAATSIWGVGTENWDSITPNWNATVWSNGNDAVFGGSATSVITLNESGINATGLTFNVAGDTLAGSDTNSLTLTSPASIAVGSGLTATISAPLAGTDGLSKLDAGTLVLAGANTYDGATTIAVGTLKLGATGDATNTPLGTVAAGTSVEATGAALDLNGFTLGTSEALTLAGTGVGATGALTNSSATPATYSGVVTIGAGGASIGGTGSIILAAGLAADANVLTKVGTASTLTLNAASSRTGAVVIAQGTLQVGASEAMGTGVAANSVGVSAGAVLDLNGVPIYTAASQVLTLNGTGISNGGALTNSSATAATYTGLLRLGSAASMVANSGDIILSNTGTITGSFPLTLGGGATGSSIASKIGTASTVTMTGTGAWTLSGANTYTGVTTIGSGILKAGSTTAFGPAANASLTFSAGSTGTLQLNNNSMTVIGLNTDATVGTPIVENGTAGSATLTVGNAAANTYAGTLQDGAAGTLALTKSAVGTLTVSGTNSYTGTTSVNGGTLLLDLTAGGALASASGLTLGGGNFSVKGATSGATAQTLGALILTTNTGSTITLDPNNSGAGGTTLTLGDAWTRGAGASLLIDAASANTGSRHLKTTGAITGTGAAVGGLLGYVLVKDATGIGFGTQDGSFNIVRNTAAGTVLTTSNAVAGATALNFTTVASDPGYVGSVLTLDNVAHSANSLAIDTTGGGTLNLGGSSGVLSLTANAILVSGAGNYTIQNGQVGAAASEVIVHQTGGGTLTISSLISSGAGALTKDGSGNLTLTGVNTYTGATNVNGGTLTIGGAGKLGNGTYLANVNLGNGGTFYYNSTATTLLKYPGVVSGAGGIVKDGTGTLQLEGANTFSGGVIIKNGKLELSDTSANIPFGTAGTGPITLGNSAGASATLQLDNGQNTSPSYHLWANPVTLGANAAGTLTISQVGGGARVGELSGAINLNGNNLLLTNSGNGGNVPEFLVSGGITGTGNVSIKVGATGGTADTTRIQISGADVAINGTISNDGTATARNTVISAKITGATTGVTQNSAVSRLTLSGANTYGGNTTVNAGTLTLTSPNPGNDASTVAIAASGAKLELAFTGTDAVAKLVIGTTTMPDGVYGATGSGATTIDDTHFAGAGTLTVTPGGAPEIAVEQPVLTDIPDNGLQGFGTVLVGSSTSLTFTIRNTGSADLTDLTITKDGANQADFTVTTNPVAPVSGPTGTTTFTVQFAPSASGAETAAIHIANNDSNENPFNITLTGTGTTPYNNWAVSKGLTALNNGPGQDPDNDGATNLAEFGFNGNPLSGSDHGQTYVLTADGDADTLKELILTAAVRKTAVFTAGAPATSALVDGIVYSIEGGTALNGFAATVNLVSPPLVPAGAPVLTGTDYEYRSFSLGGSNGLPAKGFLRAKVSQ